MRDSITELTVESFAEGPHAVPTNAHARVVADIELDARRDMDRGEEDTNKRGR